MHLVPPSRAEFRAKGCVRNLLQGIASENAGRTSAMLGGHTRLADNAAPAPAATAKALVGRDVNTPGPIRTDDPFDVSEVL